jgi:4-amino-4-deoxy-L-arabinose transferase-like glycosyltransferase
VAEESRIVAFVDKWYPVLATVVLGIAAFNLTFRLGHEYVTEWDESLYGQSAWEAMTRGSWLGTTFMGKLDYYNTKPPLLVWLIALSFKLFGPSLVSLRLVSAASSWLTVAGIQYWAKQCFGGLCSLLAGLMLATMFGFIHVHSGRSASTDALFTLLVTLTVIVAFTQIENPKCQVWLGPLLAAAFLLRGTAVLLPFSIVLMAMCLRPRGRTSATRKIVGAGLFLGPVALWMVARYRLDGTHFLGPMVTYDLVARTIRPIEDHSGRWYYYLKIFQQHHYDWLVAGAVAAISLPGRGWLSRVTQSHSRSAVVLLAIWSGLSLAVPAMMQTKVPWYLNTFYPAFSLALALVTSAALAHASRSIRRAVVVGGAVLICFSVAEVKALWYSIERRDLRLSAQSMILAEREQLRGRQLFLQGPARATHFVAEALAGATVFHVGGDIEFLNSARTGDFLLMAGQCDAPGLRLIRSDGRHFLYLRSSRIQSDGDERGRETRTDPRALRNPRKARRRRDGRGVQST